MSTAPRSDRMESSQPWYKEPWPWFIMAGPIIAIIGCVITIVLAFQNYADQDLNDGGVKRGLVVTKSASETSNKNE